MNPLRFEPDLHLSNNYRLEPDTWQTRCAFGIAALYGNWRRVAEAAIKRQEYGNTDWGIGLEYPTHPDKTGFVRWWRWQYVAKKDPKGNPTGQHRIKTRKFYLPEATYLGVLAGVLKTQGWNAQAQAIEAMMPVDKVEVRFVPDIYDRTNYLFAEYSREFDACLHVMLSSRDLDRVRIAALKRKGFNSDTHSLRYQQDGKLKITWANGTKGELSEAVYLEVMEQALDIHGLPSIRSDEVIQPEVRYKPQVSRDFNYVITPRNRATISALEVILSWPRLEEVAQVALGEHGFSGSYLSKAGTGASIEGEEVLLTYRHAVQSGGWELRISKSEYLAMLAGVLRVRGQDDYAKRIEHLMPLEPMLVQWLPDPYWPGNYQVTPYDARATDCIDLIVCRRDLGKARDEARNKTGFRYGYYVTYGLNWHRDGKVKLVMPNGNDRLIPEALYLNVLEQVLAFHGLAI